MMVISSAEALLKWLASLRLYCVFEVIDIDCWAISRENVLAADFKNFQNTWFLSAFWKNFRFTLILKFWKTGCKDVFSADGLAIEVLLIFRPDLVEFVYMS